MYKTFRPVWRKKKALTNGENWVIIHKHKSNALKEPRPGARGTESRQHAEMPERKRTVFSLPSRRPESERLFPCTKYGRTAGTVITAESLTELIEAPVLSGKTGWYRGNELSPLKPRRVLGAFFYSIPASIRAGEIISGGKSL